MLYLLRWSAPNLALVLMIAFVPLIVKTVQSRPPVVAALAVDPIDARERPSLESKGFEATLVGGEPEGAARAPGQINYKTD